MTDQNQDLKQRTGYDGKPKQWQYGFDLACREKNAEMARLAVEVERLNGTQAKLDAANAEVGKLRAENTLLHSQVIGLLDSDDSFSSPSPEEADVSQECKSNQIHRRGNKL